VDYLLSFPNSLRVSHNSATKMPEFPGFLGTWRGIFTGNRSVKLGNSGVSILRLPQTEFGNEN